MSATTWLVLAGGLSPYMLELWERVAAYPEQHVTLVHVRQVSGLRVAHEEGQCVPRRVRVVELTSILDEARAVVGAVVSSPDVLVCLGHSPIYNLAASALVRFGRLARCVVYASDTNGFAQVARMRSVQAGLALAAKRLVLGSSFDLAFSVGLSNAVAHRMLGLPEIPLSLLGVPDGASTPPQSGGAVLESRLAAMPRPLLAVVARLSPEKNLVPLVRAWRAVRRAGMAGSLVFIGEGKERPGLEAAISGEPSVTLLGPVPYWQMRHVFGRLDGLVLPSTWEPWGIVVTEALYHGVPVLASSEVGAALSLAANAPGAVAIMGTSKREIGLGLDRFIENLEEHRLAAKRAVSRIRSQYGMRAIAARLIAFGEDAREHASTSSVPAPRRLKCSEALWADRPTWSSTMAAAGRRRSGRWR